MCFGKQPRIKPTSMGSSFCFAVKLFTTWFLLNCSWIWLSPSRYFPVQNHRKDILFPSMAFLSRNSFFKCLKDLGKKIPQDPEEVQTSERAEDETPRRSKAPLPGWAAARVLQQSPTCPGFQALLDAFFFLWKSITLWNQVAVNSVGQVTEEGTDECP